MIAWRRDMRATPIASVTVTAAGSPSGMAPTASATAAVNTSANGCPRNIPTATPSAASPRISTPLNRASLRVSGVSTAGRDDHTTAVTRGHEHARVGHVRPVGQSGFPRDGRHVLDHRPGLAGEADSSTRSSPVANSRTRPLRR
jgi:hypothetical protein